MPVKGQMNKTRTAKSTKKGPKLKWWYTLPVIAIVAVAGYAIVRYGQAAVERGVQYPANGLSGGVQIQNKGSVNIRTVGEARPVFAKLGKQSFADGLPNPLSTSTTISRPVDFRGKWVCAEVWVGNVNDYPGVWQLTVKANKLYPAPPPINTYAKTYGSSVKNYFKKNAWDRQCIQIIRNTALGDSIDQVDVAVYYGDKYRPFIGVSKIWFQDNL